MLFNSISFIYFLPITLALFLLLRHTRYRIFLLLFASIIFYGYWNTYYLILIFFSILSTYFSAIAIHQFSNEERLRRIIFFAAIFVNFLILFVFKYYNFFVVDVLRQQTIVPFRTLEILLPVGISFYTFQAIGYLRDVYKKEIEPEKNVFVYSLFVTFFPQLVAGPIEKSNHLLPQLKSKVHITKDNFRIGLDWILWGFLKKVVIADRASVYVNKVYSDPNSAEPFTLLVASVLFSIQIYCDFSGYSDIAIGTAKLFGIDLIKNFNRPYNSSSIIEFWNRWHISLTQWFREYIYIPLGGNRVSQLRGSLNILIVFALSGFWHGANWTFLVWGLVHGIFLLVNRSIAKIHFLPSFLNTNFIISFLEIQKVVFTFAFVTGAWIFFRADSLSTAFLIFKKIIFEMKLDYHSLQMAVLPFTNSNTSIAFTLVLVFWILFVLSMERKEKLNFHFSGKILLLFSILIFGNFNNSSFLYFQF